MPIQIPGISGMGNIASMSDYNIIKPHVVAWRIRATWEDLEPLPGVFDYSVIEDIVDTVIADNKYVFLQVNISPASIAPSWLFSAPYSVPLVTAPGGQTYPYYLNSTFIARKNAMIDALRTRIKNTWSVGRKSKLVFWFICDGKTGDEGTGIETVLSVTINGVSQPNPNAYAITSDDWSAWKKANSWPQFYSDLAADVPTTLAAVNPSNDGENWAWSLSNIPNAGLKIGQPTHNYGNIGELFYANRCNAITDVLPNTILFGEFEQINSAGWYLISPKQNTLALILSGIAYGNCSMNIAPATFNEVININVSNDWWMFDFATEFLGLRDASTSNKAFIALRDCLDGVDTTRLPVGTYGAVIDPAQQATFNAQYNAIITSGEPIELQQDQIATITAQHFNNNRRTAIDAAFPNLTFTVLDNGQDHDAYNQDGGVYMLGNYGKFITQYDPYNTCTGYARIGATSQVHGRNCCGTNTEMFFTIDSSIVGNNSYNATFKVWYYNEGTRQWSLNYWNGSSKVNAGTITNTNTNTWIEHTFTLNNFYGGGNIDFTTDFSIKSEDGSITKIEIIRFDRISQNTVGTSGIYLIGNNLNTVCEQGVTTLYTNGAFAVGKILYTNGALTTVLTGFTYAVATSNSHIYSVNSGTGSVTADLGYICGSGTIGNYITGNTLSTICDGVDTDLYTNGSFAIGKILYTDSDLITAATGFVYLVRTSNQHIYSVNSGTGAVIADLGYICNSGTIGTYILGNNSGTVCGGVEGNLYTNGAFGVGKVLYTDSDLITIQTGFTFVVNTATNLIYNLNTSTGVVGAATGGSCTGGTAGTYKTGNLTSTVCAAGNTTLYTNGSFNISSTLYTDIALTIPATGFDFVVRTTDGNIYSVNNATGAVIAQVGICNGGTAQSVKLGNVLTSVCTDATVTVYTNGGFSIGTVLYQDVNLVNVVTGFDFFVRNLNGNIFNLNDTTGVVGSNTGYVCGSGTPETYKVGNTLSTMCAQPDNTYYTDGGFAVGQVLYADINLITPVTGNIYVVRVISGIIYDLNNVTGLINSATTSLCGGGTLTVARLGNDINTVCAQSTTNVYTDGSPVIGSFVFTDIDMTTPLTGFTLGVRDSNGRIYELDNATGEVLSQVGICGIGLPVDVTLGNVIPDICNNSPTTVYAIGNFQTGIFLYTDSNITTRVTGFIYAVAPNGTIYNIDNSTGEVLSSTSEICQSGVAENFRIGFDTDTVCTTGTTVVLYTPGLFQVGQILYTDINLTTPLTTYPFIARLSTNFIYEVDEATGEVLSNTNTKCNMALKTLTLSRLRLQPRPSYNNIVSIYWRYHLDDTETLVEANITVDPDGYFSPILTISNLDSSRQYAVVTAVNEMCETVAEQYFLLQTNISCPEGFTLSEDQTYCYIIETTTATPPTSPENAVAVTFSSYSTCGSYIYDAGYNENGTGTSTMINQSNPFWINWDSAASPLPLVCSNNNTVDGPLNRSGLWAVSALPNQDIGFSICLNISESKTYYIGIGCDNYGTIKVDGQIIVQQNVAALDIQYPQAGANSSTFKIFHIYPVVIGAGLHIIEIIGHNVSSVAAFGAEIYDNTPTEIEAATSYGDLNLLFSTKDYVGAPIQIGTDGIGYSCPDGYSLNNCDSPITCTRIITVPPIVG